MFVVKTSPVKRNSVRGNHRTERIPVWLRSSTFTSLFFVHDGSRILFTRQKKSPDLIFAARSIRGKFVNPTVYARGKRMTSIKIVIFNASVCRCISARSRTLKCAEIPDKCYIRFKIGNIHAEWSIAHINVSTVVLCRNHSGCVGIRGSTGLNDVRSYIKDYIESSTICKKTRALRTRILGCLIHV